MTDRRPVSSTSTLARFDEIEVTVEKLVAGGDGFARHQGLPVFVSRAAPGDRARVRVTERKTGYARAEIVELTTPGPGRREPVCRHFGDCGGCDLQHLEDTLQVELKVAATRETLERIGHVEIPEPVVLAGRAWGYRTRTQLHGRRSSGTAVELGDVRVGYHARGSHRLVAVEECPVLVEDLERAVRRLPALLGEAVPERLDLAVGDRGALTCAPVVPGLPHGEVAVEVGGYTYAFDARCFFQGHRDLLPQLVERVVGSDSGALAADLYSGVGLFALPLARRYERVVAVEGDRVGSRFARLNARRNGVSNIEAVHQAVESWIPSMSRDVARVVVDPPRSGLAARVTGRLLAVQPQRLTYVSCHPAALARDLRALGASYRVDELTMIDLFPQTGHLEVVAQLVRR